MDSAVAAAVEVVLVEVVSVEAVVASAEELGTVLAVAEEDSAVEQVAAPAVSVAVDSIPVRGTAPADSALADEAAPALAEQVDGLAEQDSEGPVELGQVGQDQASAVSGGQGLPALAAVDQVMRGSAGRVRQVLAVIGSVADPVGQDRQVKERIGLPHRQPIN